MQLQASGVGRHWYASNGSMMLRRVERFFDPFGEGPGVPGGGQGGGGGGAE